MAMARPGGISLTSRSRRTIGFRLGLCLGVHAHTVFRSRRPDETPSHLKLAHRLFNLSLETWRADELAFSVGRGEQSAIRYFDFGQSVRQILVRRVPFGCLPSPESEDRLDQQHVGDGIANGLVDEP